MKLGSHVLDASPDDTAIRRGLIGVLRARGRNDALIIPIGSLAVISALYVYYRADLPSMPLVAWAGAVLLATALRARLHHRGARAHLGDDQFIDGVRIGALVQGLTWGIGGAYFMRWLSGDHLALMIAAFAGVIAVAMNTLVADVAAFQRITISMTGPLFVGLVANASNSLHGLLALLTAAFTGIMLSHHRRAHGALVAQLRAIERLTASEQANAALVADLRQTLLAVRTLSGLLPICGSCKKIRDDQGYWKTVEAYVTAHTDARFSHSLCQECFPKYFPDVEYAKTD